MGGAWDGWPCNLGCPGCIGQGLDHGATAIKCSRVPVRRRSKIRVHIKTQRRSDVTDVEPYG